MIFGLFGLSGSGKTTLKKEFSQKHPEYTCLSASDLLIRNNRPISKTFLNKSTLEENQFKLIESFNTLRKTHLNIFIELHCIIEKNDSSIYLVPKEILNGLKLDYAFLLDKSVCEIYNQRQSDLSKKRSNMTLSRLKDFNKQQFSYLSEVYGSRLLKIKNYTDVEKIITHL